MKEFKKFIDIRNSHVHSIKKVLFWTYSWKVWIEVKEERISATIKVMLLIR